MIVTATAQVRHLCPYRDEIDVGTVEISWDLGDDSGDAPELYEVAEQVQRLAGEKVSHEDFTRRLLATVEADRVITRWVTAGLDITCDLSSRVTE